MVDISPETFRKFNVQKEKAIDFLKSLDVKCVRVDYGFDYSEIKAFSNEFEVVLNASTIDEDFYQKGLEKGLDFTKLIACHNFYPRKDTGLDKDWIIQKNKKLKTFGLKVMMLKACLLWKLIEVSPCLQVLLNAWKICLQMKYLLEISRLLIKN